MEKIICGLNNEYASYLEMDDAKVAFNRMVQKYPYRVLAQANYDWNEEPLDVRYIIII